MKLDPRGTVISTILRHDSKTTSYKIALLRAINDVALAFPDVHYDRPVAIPLDLLADFWIAYYWPFVDHKKPIWQGARNRRYGGVIAQDMAFRPQLTALKEAWESLWSMAPVLSDGFLVINEMRLDRRRIEYPLSLLDCYRSTIRAIAKTIEMPIRYAGPGNWSVFAKPARYSDMEEEATPVPGTDTSARCLVVPADIWKLFRELSLWIEALCVHQWALFTESVDQFGGSNVDRGDVYRLLTIRPGNRRPLTWERNHIDILLFEGYVFKCPWTQRSISVGASYDLDHLIPVSIYPMNELWNLVPSDPDFNQYTKRERLPSQEKLSLAEPILVNTYRNYDYSPSLSEALLEDAQLRFLSLQSLPEVTPSHIARATVGFMEQLATLRNVARF